MTISSVSTQLLLVFHKVLSCPCFIHPSVNNYLLTSTNLVSLANEPTCSLANIFTRSQSHRKDRLFAVIDRAFGSGEGGWWDNEIAISHPKYEFRSDGSYHLVSLFNGSKFSLAYSFIIWSQSNHES